MMFIPNVRFWELDEDDYRCYEDEVLGTHLVASENLRGSLVATAQALISQICWPFWQSPSNFPEETVQKYVEAIVKELGLDVID